MDRLFKNLGVYCIKNCETIAVAESVTAGCIQTTLSNFQQAELFFQGGITVYNHAQKAKHLGIDPIFAHKCNAVDLDIAMDMALKIRESFCSKIGIATTGYAAPYPEKNIKTPFAYFAIARKGEILLAEKLVAESKDYGLSVQIEFANKILEKLALILIES